MKYIFFIICTLVFSQAQAQIKELFAFDCQYRLDSMNNRIQEHHMFASGTAFIIHKDVTANMDSVYKITSYVYDPAKNVKKYIVDNRNRIEYYPDHGTIFIISGINIRAFSSCDPF